MIMYPHFQTLVIYILDETIGDFGSNVEKYILGGNNVPRKFNSALPARLLFNLQSKGIMVYHDKTN